MIPPPEFERIVGDLNDLIVKVDSVMENAIYQARQDFVGWQTQLDTYLFPNLVRFHAKEELLKQGVQAEDEEGSESEFHRDSNNGLLLSSGVYLIRILKSDGGDLPVPHSVSREQFYFQPPLSRELLGTPEGEPIYPHLVILWETNSDANYQGLKLVAPKSGGHSRNDVRHHFNLPLPTGAELLKPVAVKDQEIEEPVLTNREKLQERKAE